jgi:hypothetical protein
MPHIVIAESYSHLFGEEIIRQRFPDVAADVDGFDGLAIPSPTASKEKTKIGKLVYRGENFNPPIAAYLTDRGWKKYALPFRGEVDFKKGRVALEAQFGKYSFVAYDLNKFQDLFAAGEDDGIDVGIEIIPSSALARRMYTGVANFTSEVASIKSRGRSQPPMPIWIIGLDVRD